MTTDPELVIPTFAQLAQPKAHRMVIDMERDPRAIANEFIKQGIAAQKTVVPYASSEARVLRSRMDARHLRRTSDR